MDEFERGRVWQKIDEFDKRLDATCTSIAKIDQYIEDKEKGQDKKLAIIGSIIGVIAVVALFI